MKIAVTYEDGAVFQHFGKTEHFKIYEVDESKNVISSEVIGNEGAGHGALAGLLKAKGVKALLCGGIGAGAMMALADNDIDVYAGNDGACDAVVEAYLQGKLKEGVESTCDHHDHDHDHEHGCSCHCHDHDHDHDHEHEHHHHEE
jgi:predicted Fe-Mo cluster-binding NifX family protein